ncbi:immunity protein 26 of polymorphic toxin system [Archangium gephyra]|uniref:Immunity protein 26 of polymorphic toxin system n=2 Tax=Archangium gephyra TaxID=48 RepID=A0ABX9JUU1_9BACT|nr:immunity protein 26 of polymorphic toxin system [Archangium gephyra]
MTLADGSIGYGRLLESPYAAFYKYRTSSPDSDLDRIASKPILFRISVRHLALDAWEVIGERALEEHLAQPVVQFMQDLGDFRRCTIFDTVGNERDAEPQECVGLERAAVWEKEGIEARLLDALLGRPNAAEERLKVRLQ